MKVYKIEKHFLGMILNGEKKVEFRKTFCQSMVLSKEMYFEGGYIFRVICIEKVIKENIPKKYPKTSQEELDFLETYLEEGEPVWAISLGERLK